jgi:hypothetical protein
VCLGPRHEVEDGGAEVAEAGGLGLMGGRRGQSWCPDKGSVHGSAENPDQQFCDGGFLRSFREQMRGFHNLLRQKPSSLFILLGWSSVSLVSLMIRPIYLGFVESMVMW